MTVMLSEPFIVMLSYLSQSHQKTWLWLSHVLRLRYLPQEIRDLSPLLLLRFSPWLLVFWNDLWVPWSCSSHWFLMMVSAFRSLPLPSWLLAPLLPLTVGLRWWWMIYVPARSSWARPSPCISSSFGSWSSIIIPAFRSTAPSTGLALFELSHLRLVPPLKVSFLDCWFSQSVLILTSRSILLRPSARQVSLSSWVVHAANDLLTFSSQNLLTLRSMMSS